MNDSENKKASEELADETLDAVAGGAISLGGPGVLSPEEIEALLGQTGDGQTPERKR